jgi:hypothetical protein
MLYSYAELISALELLRLYLNDDGDVYNISDGQKLGSIVYEKEGKVSVKGESLSNLLQQMKKVMYN